MSRPSRKARWLGLVAGLVLTAGGVLQAQAIPSPITPSGSPLVYVTALGGSRWEAGTHLAIDARGTVYVAGVTYSLDFPVENVLIPPRPPVLRERGPGRWYLFVARLGSTGQIVYSTYLDIGSDADTHDFIAGIAPDPDGNLSIAINSRFSESWVYVAKLDFFGQDLLFLRVAGDRIDARDIAVDEAGNTYVTGFDDYDAPGVGYLAQAYVWKLDPAGWSTYFTDLNGSYWEFGNAITVDPAGNAFVTGQTDSPDFLNVVEWWSEMPTPFDAFVVRLSPSGQIAGSLRLGGGSDEDGTRIAAAGDGSVFIGGSTTSADFPTRNPLQPSLRGPQDIFLTRLDPAGEVAYSTYFGGSGEDHLGEIIPAPGGGLTFLSSEKSASGCPGPVLTTLDPTGSRIVRTACVPSLPGADVNAYALDERGDLYATGSIASANGADAFVAKLSLNSPPDCAGATASPATLWPPDGRLVPVAIRGVTDPDGDPVTLSVTAITQDEPLSRPGVPDTAGLGTPTPQVRADRAGNGDGRVYRIAFTATDTRGGICAGTVRVCVPHDQRPGAFCGEG